MSHDSPEEIRKSLPLYYAVLGALLVGTVLTVVVGFRHYAVAAAIGIAMVIASAKGSLVAAFFMHLKGEKKIIWWALGLTFVLWIPLMTLPLLTMTVEHPFHSIAPDVPSTFAEHDEHGEEGEEHAEEGEDHDEEEGHDGDEDEEEHAEEE